MSKKSKAQIARENGAKSKGPATEEGKAKSARNAIKSGDYAQKLSLFVPPDAALLCNEDRQAFFELLDQLIDTYQPQNNDAAQIVRQMAIARWQIERFNNHITMHWNIALLHAGTLPPTVVPELADLQTMVRASESVNTGAAPVEKLNRQIDRLEMRINRLRRSLKDVNALGPVQERTQAPTQPPVDNTELNPNEPQKTDDSAPPLYVTERDQIVIAAYRRDFPNRRIVFLPADDVANGIDVEDDMPVAPRKAA